MEDIIYSKFKALKEAKDDLITYFKDHNLSPLKSYLKDPIHGKVISKLLKRLNIERAKIMDQYHVLDKKERYKLFKLRKRMALKKKKGSKPVEEKAKKVKKSSESKPSKETKKAPSKYDYPLIEGREMTPEEKKKYRTQQRKSNNPTPKKEAKVKKVEKPVKEKKVKKESIPEKPIKKAKAKSKKAPKEED